MRPLSGSLGSSLREWFLTEREELTYLVNHQLGIETVGEPSGGDSDVSQGKVRARRSSVASSNRRTNSENGVDIEGQKVEEIKRMRKEVKDVCIVRWKLLIASKPF